MASVAAGRFALGSGEIHLWRASLDCEHARLERLEVLLSPDERSRADRFLFAIDRNRYIAGRGMLRELLGRYVNLPPGEVQLSYGVQGKPALRARTLETPLQFNLSHSHAIAIYAFARNRQLGVDIEQIRHEFSSEEIARRYFSPTELDELRSLPPDRRVQGFFHGWTRKEAYVKARGGGLQIPLESFDVSLTPGQPERLRSEDDSRWTLRSFQPAPGYVAAVVGEGKDWRLRRAVWRP
jgi:4'-phosphopantetheinyl transferase